MTYFPNAELKTWNIQLVLVKLYLETSRTILWTSLLKIILERSLNFWHRTIACKNFLLKSMLSNLYGKHLGTKWMKDYRTNWHTDVVNGWHYKQLFWMKIEENFTEFEYDLRFLSLPKFTYSILYVAINYVYNNISKTVR